MHALALRTLALFAALLSVVPAGCDRRDGATGGAARAESDSAAAVRLALESAGTESRFQHAVVGFRRDSASMLVAVAARPEPGMRDGCAIVRVRAGARVLDTSAVRMERWCRQDDVTRWPRDWPRGP